MQPPLRIAIIGGGPAGLMAAETLAPHAQVHLYEHGKHIGRKFLVAGQGGFNLTNQATGVELLKYYAPSGFLDAALNAFGTEELRAWLAALGIPTYTGTSGRVFPAKGIKPIDVLERIHARVLERGAQVHTEHAFIGFGTNGSVLLENRQGPVTLEADHVIFALGGASWPVTGSTGIWPSLFKSIGVGVCPFRSSNCGLEIAWPEALLTHEGKPLKNVRITAGDRSAWGEATLTRHGLEGNAIYPVVPAIREGATELLLDLKPESSPERLVERIGHKAARHFGEATGLNRAQLALVKAFTPKDVFASPQRFAEGIKNLHLPVSGLRPVGEAISTVGGIPVEALHPNFTFKQWPQFSAIGEMVDWDAPTGGFLLQGCFAMGRYAAQRLLALHGINI